MRALIARSMAAALGTRQLSGLQSTVSDAKTALSSWDNCMAFTFCKWPVIGIIIFGSLIVFSIVWCCARCLCCGLSCCCECCQCLKCCGSCCGMCDPPGGRKHKYLDEPLVPPHQNQVYRSQAPMDYPPQRIEAPPKREVPQYATFESDKKDADSLPAMPTWNDGSSQKVLIETEAVEMEPLKKPTPASSIVPTATGRTVSPMPLQGYGSPVAVSPYGPPQGRPGPNGYAGAVADPYAQQDQGYFNDNEYGQQHHNHNHNMDQSQEYGLNQAYGGTAGVMAAGRQPYGQQGQAQNMHSYGNQPGNQLYGQQGPEVDAYGNSVQPDPYGQQGYPQAQNPRQYPDEYGRSMTPSGLGRSMTPGAPGRTGTPGSGMRTDEYGRPSPAAYSHDNLAHMDLPGPQGGSGYRSSPGPQGGNSYGQQQGIAPGGFEQPPPRRQYTGDLHNQYSGTSSQSQYGDSQQQQYPQSRDHNNDYHHAGASSHSYDYQSSAQQPAELYSPTAIAPASRAAELHSEPASPLNNNFGLEHAGHARASPAPAAGIPAAVGGGGYPGQRQYKPQSGY